MIGAAPSGDSSGKSWKSVPSAHRDEWDFGNESVPGRTSLDILEKEVAIGT